MDNIDLDQEIRKIIQKADKIVHLEQLEKDRIETLTALREEDGRIKFSLIEKKKRLVEKKENLSIAQSIWSEYRRYLELISQYTGDELIVKLEEEIDDYSWPKYSKIQDQLYKVTKDKSENDLIAEIDDLEKNINELENKRSDLVDNSLLIIKELDQRINNLK